MIGILFMMAAAAGADAAAAAPEPAQDDLDAAFYVMRNGEPIGYHVVDVETTDDGYIVETRIEMRVKFGPIPLYRYRHAATEFWRDGAIQSLDSVTDDNGETMALSVRREDGVLLVEGDAYSGPAPDSAMPSSYWNRAVIGTDIVLNTQNGELIRVNVANLGESDAPYGGAGEQFRIIGTLALNIWYDGERWIGSNFIVDGEELTYKRVEELDERQRLLASLEESY